MVKLVDASFEVINAKTGEEFKRHIQKWKEMKEFNSRGK